MQNLLGHPWAEDLVGGDNNLDLRLSVKTRSGNPNSGVGWNDNNTDITAVEDMWGVSPGLPRLPAAAAALTAAAAPPAAVTDALLSPGSD